MEISDRSDRAVVWLFVPDLCGFCGLLTDRHRPRATAWIQTPRQFQLSLSFILSCGVLEKMAYLLVELPARLSLYSVGRKQERRTAHLCQSADRDVSGRSVAWRGMEFCRLGTVARHRTGA